MNFVFHSTKREIYRKARQQASLLITEAKQGDNCYIKRAIQIVQQRPFWPGSGLLC